MLSNRKNIDELIKESLSKEEAKFYDELDEYSVMESFTSTFKGKSGVLMMMAVVFVLLVVIVGFYCLTQFLQAETEMEMMKWGAAMLSSLIIVSILKVYGWMQMDKNVLLREIKRLELQVSLLSKKMDGAE